MSNNIEENLGELIMFVSEVIISARMSTAYNPDAKYNQDSPVAAMWFMNMLHHIYGIGEAIKAKHSPAIISEIQDVKQAWIKDKQFIDMALRTNKHVYSWDVNYGLALLEKIEVKLKNSG
ncbi:hypothetical protein [Thalassotalea piscium]|uniref:Uncharacterized protein n=1 Tax=Thalassotalea piscium TaxID=1230533 RepID=A0A7X0TTD3_9GAMM|nr:hypothetical protein [Thalassotalea piscium]MBB6543106.1 hypothetical protein [Thalassotalea piscium]